MRHFGGTSELHVLLTGFVVNDMLLLVLILEKKKEEQINNAGSHNWICFRQKKEKIITRFYQKMNLKQNPLSSHASTL